MLQMSIYLYVPFWRQFYSPKDEEIRDPYSKVGRDVSTKLLPTHIDRKCRERLLR
jgi:hypothetical protein